MVQKELPDHIRVTHLPELLLTIQNKNEIYLIEKKQAKIQQLNLNTRKAFVLESLYKFCCCTVPQRAAFKNGPF